MASYTTSLRLVQPTTGEYPGTWGTQVNNGLTALVDTSVAGTANIVMTAADYTLTTANGATDEARAAILNVTGTPGAARNIIVPALSKLYVVFNNTTGGFAQTVKTSAGTGISVPNGATAYLRCNGTDVVAALNYFGSLTVGTVTGGTFVSPSLTGTPTAPTASPGTNTTQIATTAFVNVSFAPLASPALTGTPTAPTATTGTNTTQIATTAFVAATAFNTALPNQTGNAGKYVTTDGSNASWADVYPSQTGNAGKYLTTNGTTIAWGFAGIAQVTTATTSTTLTNTATLLQITPANYGVTVTLPDATTCSVGGPLHCIDNRGDYPVRVCDSTGALKGFIFAGVVSYVSLDNNSTAAGTWAISNKELVGGSAQLITSTLVNVFTSIGIDNNREIIIGCDISTNNCYGVVYDKSTNTFGSVTLIRNAASFGFSTVKACLSGANQVLVVSCRGGTSAFEAVTLSISGTTITVNTAATATLSASISSFAVGGLIAVGSSFVTCYTVSTPAAEIRALSISGTTVTIGSATALDGTFGPLQLGVSSSVVLCVSFDGGGGTSLFTRPYTVSGSTLTAGTGTTTAAASAGGYDYRFAALGTRFYIGFKDGASNLMGGIITVTGTTSTISVVQVLTSNSFRDAIIVGSNKVLVLGGETTNNANILTDTAGTASAGTAITISSTGSRFCLYINGTDVYIQDGQSSTLSFAKISCSGASPVLTWIKPITTSSSFITSFLSSDALMRRSSIGVYGSNFAATVLQIINNSYLYTQMAKGDVMDILPNIKLPIGYTVTAPALGRNESEVWGSQGGTAFPTPGITKVECAA